MAKFLHGQFYITNLENNDNLGVSVGPPIYPSPPVPVIVLPKGVLPPVFTIEAVNGGDNTYVIKVGNKNTRGLEDRVYAFETEPAEEWVIRYKEYQDAYTIEKRGGEPIGWTVPQEDTEPKQVVLRPIVSTRSLPPRFLPSQLFRFENAGPQE